ncbi:hypothetical protein J416_04386 [Gracilibacillus halophilus YIM-C55.5]|uniref:Integral membrane protein n=1 Tax=Gracilibacillus halophilus YIM-C55.5 TaxID=1308866 RepID=N4WBI8_9BACI|nr:hypothetical protein [Gracilibacillus halophilus]ENH97653.1 hypothetical protein J416_04386 [Gracilibacillus halophilus YIM-C55.5]
MDWVKLVYLVILLISGVFVFLAPFFQKGDERRKFINSKAQSYAFTVIIGMLIISVVRSIYLTIQGNTSYNGDYVEGSPISFLSVTLIVYLITLLVYRKKYGD